MGFNIVSKGKHDNGAEVLNVALQISLGLGLLSCQVLQLMEATQPTN
jgi:hypothetical protein